MVGCGRAAAMGIFVRSGDVLERLAKVTGVVFDKTGTLTERHAEVTAGGRSHRHVRGRGAGVGGGGGGGERPPDRRGHLWRQPPPVSPAADVRSVPGSGVVGVVGGRRVEVSRLVPDRPTGLAPGCRRRTVRAGRDGGHGGTRRRDHRGRSPSPRRSGPRPSRPSPTSVRWVSRRPCSAATASRLSARWPPNWASPRPESGLSPAGKVEALAAMRRDSQQVVMVGDGVNDAPALAAADVGCAIGSGSEAALANSDVALLGNDLQGVPAAIGVAGSTYSVISAELRMGHGLQRRRASPGRLRAPRSAGGGGGHGAVQSDRGAQQPAAGPAGPDRAVRRGHGAVRRMADGVWSSRWRSRWSCSPG